MSLKGNWSFCGIPIKIAAKWLINHHPRDKDGEPILMASEPIEFLIVLIACGEVKVFPIGTCGHYITICSKEYKILMENYTS